jgi:hypothetical protein
MTRMLHCLDCGEFIEDGRSVLGYKTCKGCGEVRAVLERDSWCVVPMPKSNYVLVTDKTLLKGLNSSHKGGVR